ncbi:MAG: OmpA family protein [Deltaproteobacteria bacterium]|jgi:chemotaxis protein MotB|nr:OmpA family protein [Deltaproteobacteria bacterium]
MGESKSKKIIIKRIKKHHAEGHSGSWKVAYADFVTAMMAFFLLMWLINMTSQQKRAVLAYYFRNFSLFTKGGVSFMYKGGNRPVGQNYGDQSVLNSGRYDGGLTNNDLAKQLMTGISQSGPAAGAEKHVYIEVTSRGVRIQIVDTKKHPIFQSASAEVTELGKQIIRSVVSVIKNFPNKIAVEGYTDSAPPGAGQMSNWELSVARALSAKRVIEQDGINPVRICRVVGYSDRKPIFPRGDPRNRRISILFCARKKQKPPDNLQWLLKPAG